MPHVAGHKDRYYPTYSGADVVDPNALDQDLYRAYEWLYELRTAVQGIDSEVRSLAKSTQPGELRTQLQVGGAAPLNVTFLQGASDFDAEEGDGALLRTDGASELTGARTVSGLYTFSTAPAFTSAGAPFTVSSATMVALLNANSLNGHIVEGGAGNVLLVDGTTTLSGVRAVSANWNFTTSLVAGGSGVTDSADLTVKHTSNPALLAIGRTDSGTGTQGSIGFYNSVGDQLVHITGQKGAAANDGVLGITTMAAGTPTQALTIDESQVTRVWGSLRVGDDVGSGLAGTITHTDDGSDTPTTDPGWATSSTVNMNPPDGYIKAYVGTQAVVLPYWNT